MNGEALRKIIPVRMFLGGFPGAGKTGAISSLLNAGFKVRVLGFDKVANFASLVEYTEPDALKNLDLQLLEDTLKDDKAGMRVSGTPTAFSGAHKLMDHWKYTDEDGQEVDLGHSREWGCDTVVVLDSLTSMGIAAKRRSMFLMNKTPLNNTDRVYGHAMADQEAFLEKLASSRNRFHLIVTAHWRMIGPRDVRKGEDDLTEKIKREQGELIQTRYYPSALGWQLPQTIGGILPTILEVVNKVKHGRNQRVIQKVASIPVDLKAPSKALKDSYPIEDGLVQIFEALSPGVTRRCIGSNRP